MLTEYVSHLSRVRLVRSVRRLGVGGCRSLGAARAEGQVLVFMDSHCECEKGWLEPLLDRVAHDRSGFFCVPQSLVEVFIIKTCPEYVRTLLSCLCTTCASN